jgi:hypothetical protein
MWVSALDSACSVQDQVAIYCESRHEISGSIINGGNNLPSELLLGSEGCLEIVIYLVTIWGSVRCYSIDGHTKKQVSVSEYWLLTFRYRLTGISRSTAVCT